MVRGSARRFAQTQTTCGQRAVWATALTASSAQPPSEAAKRNTVGFVPLPMVICRSTKRHGQKFTRDYSRHMRRTIQRRASAPIDRSWLREETPQNVINQCVILLLKARV